MTTTALGRFWAGFKHGYRTPRPSSTVKQNERRGWRTTIEAFIALGVMAAAGAASAAYKEGGWSHLFSWAVAAKGVILPWASAALAVIAFLWLLWRLSRPVVTFLIDEGVVGCWRWLGEKVFTPILYGRKRK